MNEPERVEISSEHEILTRGVEEVIVREHLEEAMLSGKKLRVKFGIDPTAPDLHLGHTVPLRKLRAFQDLGHRAVLIIGDFTAMVGDPSGRSDTRKILTEQEVRANMEKYLAQAGLILNLAKTEVRYNSEWYKKEGVALLLGLLSQVSVQRATERDDFRKRMDQGQDVSVLEIVYPMLQGYDSVAVDADVELGGTDQKFNLLMGRRIQRHYGKPEQDVMTTWLIEGTDGGRKMSKSVGNYIGLGEEPQTMFGKLMSIPDDLIVKYFTALTDMPLAMIREMQEAMASRAQNPRDAKLELAQTLVGMYHGETVALKARGQFLATFSEGRTPDEMPEVSARAGAWNPAELLIAAGLASSKAEARRLIAQSAVTVDGAILKDPAAEITVKKNTVIKAGKHRFVRIV